VCFMRVRDFSAHSRSWGVPSCKKREHPIPQKKGGKRAEKSNNPVSDERILRARPGRESKATVQDSLLLLGLSQTQREETKEDQEK